MAVGVRVTGRQGGLPCIDVGDMLGVISGDVKRTVRYALDTRGAKAKLVFVPHEPLMGAVQQVMKLYMAPFVPVVDGIPCQFSPASEVRVACVADDNTNFEKQGNTDQEGIH